MQISQKDLTLCERKRNAAYFIFVYDLLNYLMNDFSELLCIIGFNIAYH